MINAVEFTTPLQEYLDEHGKPLSYLTEISHINILIGENNSGKSRFIRYLIKNNRAYVLDDDRANGNEVEVNRIRRSVKNMVKNLVSNSVPISLSEEHDNLLPCGV